MRHKTNKNKPFSPFRIQCRYIYFLVYNWCKWGYLLFSAGHVLMVQLTLLVAFLFLTLRKLKWSLFLVRELCSGLFFIHISSFILVSTVEIYHLSWQTCSSINLFLATQGLAAFFFVSALFF